MFEVYGIRILDIAYLAIELINMAFISILWYSIYMVITIKVLQPSPTDQYRVIGNGNIGVTIIGGDTQYGFFIGTTWNGL